MPNMLGTGSPYHGFLEEAHELLGYAMVALVAAAIWHERVRRDGVLTRMISGRS
jgi:cytochrome b561